MSKEDEIIELLDDFETQETETEDTEHFLDEHLPALAAKEYQTRSLVDTESFDHYFKMPILTLNEEQLLAKEFHDEGNIKAAHALVLSHMRFVVKIARMYMGYGLGLNELVQEGAVGLMKAVKKFNPAVGVRLVSFAVHWIKSEINEYVIKNWRIVKIATTKAHRKLFFNLRRLRQEGLLSSKEIALELGVPVEDVEVMEKRIHEQELHLDHSMQRDDSSSLKLIDTIASDSISPEEWMIEEKDNKLSHDSLCSAMEKLNSRDQEIIRTRYLLEDKKTLQELSCEFNISIERVRQLEKNALGRLKNNILADFNPKAPAVHSLHHQC